MGSICVCVAGDCFLERPPRMHLCICRVAFAFALCIVATWSSNWFIENVCLLSGKFLLFPSLRLRTIQFWFCRSLSLLPTVTFGRQRRSVWFWVLCMLLPVCVAPLDGRQGGRESCLRWQSNDLSDDASLASHMPPAPNVRFSQSHCLP